MRPACRQQWRRCPRLRAGAGDSDALPVSMTAEEAEGILGLSSSKVQGFEEILSAKNKLVAANQSNKDKIMQIEAAYDVLFMRSMKRRISGEVEVSTSVRFADVPNTKKRSSSSQRGGTGQGGLLQKLPGGGITVETPKQNVVALQAAVFGGLALWAAAQAALEAPDIQAADTGGLQLALAGAFAVYSFKENKRLSIGRSAGLTFGSLVAGVLLGALLNSWLRVDIVPLGTFASPGVLVTDIAIVAVWAGCTFLA